MVCVRIDSLVFDKRLQPRDGVSQKTVDAYTEALQANAIFPPILTQRILNYRNGDGQVYPEVRVALDGWHRAESHKQAEREEIEAQDFKEEPIDYGDGSPFLLLLLEAASPNTKHGDRLKETDKKNVAVRIAEQDPDCQITGEMMAEKLSAPVSTVLGWIAQIRARQRASRASQVIKLGLLGWENTEIGELFGLTEGAVRHIRKFSSSGEITNSEQEPGQGRQTLLERIQGGVERGLELVDIAEHEGLSLPVVYALLFQGKSDRERFEALDWGLRTWDLWNFNDCDERFGDDWPGRIPAQLVAHTLFYFTEPNALVLDPMAGGGVVPDTCLAFGRRCRSYDIALRPHRPEIEEYYWQADESAWPEVGQADLIFFDPPYFTKMDEAYRRQAGERIPLSALSREDYLKFFRVFFLAARDHVKRDGRIAFLNADWRDFQSTPAQREKAKKSVTVFDYRDLLEQTGWEITHRVECPLSSQRMNGITVSNMQEGRILGTVGRTLLMARRKSRVNNGQ